MALLPCSILPIGLLQGRGYVCDMMIVNIVMMMMMKIIFLSGMMVIKNESIVSL